MADEGDCAEAYQARHNAESLALALVMINKLNDAPPPLSGICIDCGDRIPKARRKAAPRATRCCECQQQHEFKHRSRGL